MIFNMELELMVFWATAFSAVGAIMSALVAAMQFRATKIQEHRSLESIYLNRLWVILDKMGNSIDALDKKEVYREYIEFCRDQIELRELGRITGDTWDFWARDMKEFYGEVKFDEEFKNVLNAFMSENTRKSSYYKAMMKCPADTKFDPLINPVDGRLAKRRYKFKICRWLGGL